MLATRKPDYQLDAWGLLQKAYYFWLSEFTVENVVKATDCLRKAISIEPDYAAARASLGMLLSQLTTSRVCEDYDAVFAEAKQAAEEAFRLRPNDADVLESVGVAFQNTGQGKRAVKVLRRAVEIAPLNLISRGYLAMTLAFTGGAEGATEAKTLLKENFRIAPHHPSAAWWHFFMAVADQAVGDYESSLIHCEKSLQGQHAWVHTYFFLANALCETGDPDEARHYLAAAGEVNPAYSLELYVENLVLISGSESLAKAFCNGLNRLESRPEPV
jgi:tetratricopeptide (TPR) repeat protein